MSEIGHVKLLRTETIGLRICLKRFVSGLGVSLCRVFDSCCVTDCNPTANVETRVESLRTVTASDSVHFLGPGYDNLGETLCARKMKP